MGQTIEKQHKTGGQKIQLIYAFNGTGKTRLSRKFRLLLTQGPDDFGTEIKVLL